MLKGEIRGFPLIDIYKLTKTIGSRLGVIDYLDDAFQEACLLLLQAKQVPSIQYAQAIIRQACINVYKLHFSVATKFDLVPCVSLHNLDVSEEEYLDLLPTEVDYEKLIEEKEVMQKLENLTEFEQNVIKLIFFEGLKYEEVANRLGYSRYWIIQTFNRAIKKLRYMYRMPENKDKIMWNKFRSLCRKQDFDVDLATKLVLGEKTGLPASKVGKLKRHLRAILSLDKQLQEFFKGSPIYD